VSDCYLPGRENKKEKPWALEECYYSQDAYTGSDRMRSHPSLIISILNDLGPFGSPVDWAHTSHLHN